MSQRQQTRINLLRSNLEMIIERRDGALKRLIRWESARLAMEARLKRAIKRDTQQRAERRDAHEEAIKPFVDASDIPETKEEFFQNAKVVIPGEEPIPSFLDRRQAVEAANAEIVRQMKESAAKDAEIAEQLKKEQAEKKRLKSLNRIAKMKAKAAGDLRKMPLTGRAALAAIRRKG